MSKLLSTKRGKIISAAVIVAVVACVCVIVCNCRSNADVSGENGEDISFAVEKAILNDNENYADAEFFAEGHVIFGTDETDDGMIKVYAAASNGGYSFMNGMFVKNTGSGAIPRVVTLRRAEDGDLTAGYGVYGGYVIVDVEEPTDGSYYESSIREMFPLLMRGKALNADEYYDELKEQEHEQCREYLSSIGRGDAEVGEYIDLNSELPSMSAEASNKLLELEKEDDWYYPIYLGTYERLEDGERFVYETKYDGDESGGIVTYTKYDADGNTVSKIMYEVDGDNVNEI